ncbi:hypothetical protein Hanom_Chr05g00406421 [Helianthus anomalus]
MHEEFEEAKFYGRYDKKRECYINRNGHPVIHRREVVYNDVLVDDLKKVAEKEKMEREKEEEAIGDEVVTGEQKTEEGLKKKGDDDAKLKDRLKQMMLVKLLPRNRRRKLIRHRLQKKPRCQ